MAPWTPSEDTELHGMKSDRTEAHVREFQYFGPPPPNFHIKRDKRKLNQQLVRALKYTDQSVANAPYSWDHPLSDTSLAFEPNPNIAPEPEYPRAKRVGYFDPPFVYRAHDWIWNHFDHWQGALADALGQYDITVKKEPITATKIARTHKRHILEDIDTFKGYKKIHELYHPADRDRYIFDGEAECAYILRTMAKRDGVCFSLVIVSPLVMRDGRFWNKIWDTSNRPPVIARWSTGLQGLHRPLILGCLPKFNPMGKQDSREVMWFSLRPNIKDNKHPWWFGWSRQWNVKECAELIDFPIGQFGAVGGDIFLYSIVYLHRMVALGLELDEGELGSWLQQFGEYLHVKRSTNQHKTFLYDTYRFVPYKVKAKKLLNFHILTAWVLNPGWRDEKGKLLSKQPRHYAVQWDDAIQAKFNYRTKRDGKLQDDLWDEYKKKAALVAQPPF
ncbi:hypothetical protein DM02DRAFT_655598 [Periconia macrospinosa]|uniref:Uncharacterized protein n=1 Tax=Periconia macrospinosa TaxID=97972 RepID=A0A2V1DQ91_9PLEO|nr:hypothetical protein DM02DRAFT_655598 [Periconia macrospinosa]